MNTDFKIESTKEKNINVIKTILGLLLISGSVSLFLSFFSFLIYWRQDQTQTQDLLNKEVKVENILGKVGAIAGDRLMYHGIGICIFLLPFFLFLVGLKILFRWRCINIKNFVLHSFFFIIWLPVSLAFISPENGELSGVFGFEMQDFFAHLIGKVGVGMSIVTGALLYGIAIFKITPDQLKKKKSQSPLPFPIQEEQPNTEKHIPSQKSAHIFPISSPPHDTTSTKWKERLDPQLKTLPSSSFEVIYKKRDQKTNSILEKPKPLEMMVESPGADINKMSHEQKPIRLQKNLNFPMPSPNLMYLPENYHKNISINQKELEVNKDKIIETLRHYKIGIEKIKATVGPSVTLYEIIPVAGIRISKIKNLEDDIALSLSALGIRIIAPILGKGTIGIEVPNRNPSIVYMRMALSSQRFQNAKMELPIVLGKTISNETFVTDLAKMPHLLMAGATGQGKSVGLNAIIVALLHKKAPQDLKFVMIDPKKVELSLYKKIEKYYLAKLPDTEEAVITDTAQAKNALNSLCKEMDRRYELLKKASVRNIKEYNQKFYTGQEHLPYIVLVIDEFADLIMTAGREIEVYIARLAQLARAIGIHLIIATQRPSVNVITGLIKANFPARIAFRVTSKIDSRTILDAAGADQLIGKGDMLFSNGNELIRLQCPFIDTQDVEKMISFYQEIPKNLLFEEFHLPKPDQQESKIDYSEGSSSLDPLFEEAARIVIATQQGSSSILQRKLSIGFNRAAKIVEQLEENGIIGPFEGSKARQVLISDEQTLQSTIQKNNRNF
ncbi:MAG: DNA translocase FtsK [Flavobacteriales bacterium Tduv]